MDPSTISRRQLITAGGATAVAALAGCTARATPVGRVDYREAEGRTFQASEVATLTVANDIGDVTVEGGGVDDVDVVVTRIGATRREAAAIDVEIVLDGDALVVETAVPSRRVRRVDGTPRTDIRVLLPTPGPVVESLTTSVGNVILRDARGDATLAATAGAVRAERVDGFLTLAAEVGEVAAGEVTGIDRAVTSVGAVKVEIDALRGDTTVGTDVGATVVGVAAALDADVLAEAEGRVDAALPLTDDRRRRGRVTGRLNAGGHRLHVFSGLGDVTLRARS